MLVKSFLALMDTAPVRERAEAVTMLARAYLDQALGGDTPEAVEAALTAVLDDPVPVVRRALAIAFSEQPAAPRHIVLGLATDQAEVAGLLIARSPLLTEADLIDIAVTGERLSLMAVAFRPDVTRRISRAIVARQDFDSAFTLVGNASSEIDEADLLLIVEHFGQHARLREALLARANLSASVRHALMVRVAANLGGFVTEGGFLNSARNTRMMEETVQSGTVSIARGTGKELSRFIAHLRESGQLTPALLLRSVLGGETRFIAAALADLCQLEPARTAAIVASGTEPALHALLRRAGLPPFLHPVLVACVRAAIALPPAERRGAYALPVVRAAQAGCLEASGEEGVRLMALLRRYEAEAARAESRRIAESLRREGEPEKASSEAPPLDIGPEMLRLGPSSGRPGPEKAETATSSDGRMARRIEAVLARTSSSRVTEAPAPENSAREILVQTRSEPANTEQENRAPAPRIQENRAAGPRGDGSAPSLKFLIAEWKAERALLDRLDAAKIAATTGNRNDRPGVVRVA
jgi:uncharacterized protein (DUF2336 family)